MPEDLAQQVPYIRRALEAYRIPMLGVTRFEADDVIGTLARKAADAAHPVYIVSSDKDMMQLVNDKVHVLNPPKDNLICDAAKVEEILGVPPERVIDVMALRGDSIDNIPGAPGIGDKGSVEIIKRFGSRRSGAGSRSRSRDARPIANRCRTIATPSCSARAWRPSTRMCRWNSTWTPCTPVTQTLTHFGRCSRNWNLLRCSRNCCLWPR